MQRPIHKDYQPFLYEGGAPDYPFSIDPDSPYYRFWETETNRCLNGYDPGGGLTPMTGNLYFYMNHVPIPIGIGAYEYLIPPFYRDLEHEWFDFQQKELAPIFDADGNFVRDAATCVVPKSRDKGFTMMQMGGNVIYNFVFFPNSHSLVGTGNEDEMNKNKDVLRTSYLNLTPAFQHQVQKKNAKFWLSGTEEEVKNEAGQIVNYKESGVLSTIHFRDNFNRKVDAANSLRVKYALFDEAGLINRLLKIMRKNRACFNRGSHQYAIVIVGGTSKVYEATDTDYEDMYYKAKDLGFKTWFIPASKALIPFIDLSTGKSDIKAARAHIQAKYDQAEKVSVEQRQMEQQEYPLEVDHCFLKKSSSYLPGHIIDEQITRILEHPDYDPSVLDDNPELEVGRVEWVDKVGGATKWFADPRGKILRPGPPYYEEWKQIYKDAEIGAVDSYNKEESVESDSKGSCHIYRRFTEISRPGCYPVLEYFDRPTHTVKIFEGKDNEETLVKKDIFYDNLHKIAVHWGVKLLVEDTDEELFRFFRKRNANKYLARTPMSAVSDASKVVKKFGVPVGEPQLAKMTDLIDQNLCTYPQNIPFLNLLRELKRWRQANTDRAISWGLCLLYDSDLNAHKKPARKVDEEKKTKSNFTTTYVREGGKLVRATQKGNYTDYDNEFFKHGDSILS